MEAMYGQDQDPAIIALYVMNRMFEEVRQDILTPVGM